MKAAADALVLKKSNTYVELPAPAALRGSIAYPWVIAGAGGPDRAVQQTTLRLLDPRQRVESLAGDVGLSERQLRRRCRAGVGYGPRPCGGC